MVGATHQSFLFDKNGLAVFQEKKNSNQHNNLVCFLDSTNDIGCNTQ